MDLPGSGLVPEFPPSPLAPCFDQPRTSLALSELPRVSSHHVKFQFSICGPLKSPLKVILLGGLGHWAQKRRRLRRARCRRGVKALPGHEPPPAGQPLITAQRLTTPTGHTDPLDKGTPKPCRATPLKNLNFSEMCSRVQRVTSTWAFPALSPAKVTTEPCPSVWPRQGPPRFNI